jgi:hypothetical protein
MEQITNKDGMKKGVGRGRVSGTKDFDHSNGGRSGVEKDWHAARWMVE